MRFNTNNGFAKFGSYLTISWIINSIFNIYYKAFYGAYGQNLNESVKYSETAINRHLCLRDKTLQLTLQGLLFRSTSQATVADAWSSTKQQSQKPQAAAARLSRFRVNSLEKSYERPSIAGATKQNCQVVLVGKFFRMTKALVYNIIVLTSAVPFKSTFSRKIGENK